LLSPKVLAMKCARQVRQTFCLPGCPLNQAAQLSGNSGTLQMLEVDAVALKDRPELADRRNLTDRANGKARSSALNLRLSLSTIP
jgi:hypothetical protein